MVLFQRIKKAKRKIKIMYKSKLLSQKANQEKDNMMIDHYYQRPIKQRQIFPKIKQKSKKMMINMNP